MSIALTWLLTEHTFGQDADGKPLECCDCPFGVPSPDREEPNPSDPGEGYYDCALLKKRHIWGEGPECQPHDWRGAARRELSELGCEMVPQYGEAVNG